MGNRLKVMAVVVAQLQVVKMELKFREPLLMMSKL